MTCGSLVFGPELFVVFLRLAVTPGWRNTGQGRIKSTRSIPMKVH
jgi:hypothetical protein